MRRRPRARHLAPAQAIVIGFGSVILLGATLLSLPISSASGKWTGAVDALFTATSAVCVTGLVVVDTASYWSGFGLAVILVLIQLGGLGIMIFAALVGLAIARRMTVRSRLNTATEAKAVGFADVRGLARGILSASLLIEGMRCSTPCPRSTTPGSRCMPTA